MNSIIVVVLVAAGFLATVYSLPTSVQDENQRFAMRVEVDESEEQTTLDDLMSVENSDETGERFRRVTCDLLSISTMWGALNHSACAAHCLAKRKHFRGGYCKNGVCHCRK